MAPKVHWLIRAQDRLEETIAATICRSVAKDTVGTPTLRKECLSAAYRALVSGLEDKLQGTFPEAESVIVVDTLQSYTQPSNRFVLRVEVAELNHDLQQIRPHAYIVKIAHQPQLACDTATPEDAQEDQTAGEDTERRLGAELQGWEACQRRGNERGRIFMYLRPGKPFSKEEGSYETLKYEDAHQVLRAAEVITLEEAVIDACCWGRPPADSVVDVITQIFYEMSDRFYKRSWSEEPTARDTGTLWHERLETGIERWESPSLQPGKARIAALSLLSETEKEFLDPCNYLNEIWCGQEDPPEMQRGCAHGDLHGRNVLVGLIDGQAKWPAVFDYEDMRCDNHLAWDFVKLEMELKIRTLRHVMQGEESDFVKRIYAFELELACETEKRNNAPTWTRDKDLDKGRDALLGILLGIRRMAKMCLEEHRGRNRRWLDEYYFLLTCYGVYAGKFKTYQWRELLAAFICTGIAAYRYAWRRGISEKQEREARSLARKAIEEGEPTIRPGDGESLCYQAKLAFASVFARSRRADFIATAVEILKDLRTKHQWIADIGHELTFAMLELSSLDPANQTALRAEAKRLLDQLEDQFRGGNDELFGRIGRFWKECGDITLEAADEARATDYYGQALQSYGKAYAANHHYYPGINVASLLWLMENDDEAQRIARDILARFTAAEEDGERWKGDELWVAATKGEAHLLLGEIKEAKQCYRQAIRDPECTPQARDSMKQQINRILRRQQIEGLSPGALDDLFDQ